MADRGLKELLDTLETMQYSVAHTLDDVQVTAVTSDSRRVVPGALFVAVPGLRADGHDFVADAVQKGCAAVILQKGRRPAALHGLSPMCIEVADTREALGLVAASFWQEPAREMTLIGITGTNGKTTTAYLLEALIRQGGGNPGIIGTVNYRYGGKELPAPFTTPCPEVLHGLLREMADHGVTHVIMEVSSHALEQKRLAGLAFDVALFTNLSRDHLDFHGDMASYYASKKRLFLEHLKPEGKAVVLDLSPADRERRNTTGRPDWGKRLADDLVRARRKPRSGGTAAPELIRCGTAAGSVSVEKATENLAGLAVRLRLPAGTARIHSSLVGDFNVRNLLGAAGVGVALGYAIDVIQEGLSKAAAAPGRLERVSAGAEVEVFVDYAHTPDALENVLKTLRKLAAKRLIVVFGCGGDRDPGKRPLMGEVAGRYADVTVLTTDNPRTESPVRILAEMEQGLRGLGVPRMRLEAMMHRSGGRGYDVILSRKEAIRDVIRFASRGDLVLVSGKGHETYQIFGSKKIFFDDRLAAREQLLVERW